MHTLVLDVPPSANRYKSRRVVQLAGKAPLVVDHLTHEARQYKEAAQWVARAAGIREPSLGRIAMQIDLYPQRPLDWQARARKDPLGWASSVRSIDVGNVEKVISDSLNGIAYADDRQIDWLLVRRCEPADKKRVVVTITTIDPLDPQVPLAKADDPFWQERRAVERSTLLVAPEAPEPDDGALFV